MIENEKMIEVGMIMKNDHNDRLIILTEQLTTDTGALLWRGNAIEEGEETEGTWGKETNSFDYFADFSLRRHWSVASKGEEE
tara:strand:+ start:763 stop:1008 length:246 start_codon:yes stop_codon:yes gene_type:complete